MFVARATAGLRRSCSEVIGATGRHVVDAARAAIDLLFPPCCMFCRCDLERHVDQPMLCQACVDRFRSTRSACRRCASPLPDHWHQEAHCPLCGRRTYHFERAVALGNYGSDLKQAVLWMKRLPFEPLTQAVGRLLGRHVSEELASWRPEGVVPVPMHFWRRLRRGVQPSHVLAGQVARVLELPFHERLLRCRRNVRKQGTLSPGERFRNMRGAFSVSTGYDINEKRLLLVDDIMTTGATASEAARILGKAGAAGVAVAVVARGLGR